MHNNREHFWIGIALLLEMKKRWNYNSNFLNDGIAGCVVVLVESDGGFVRKGNDQLI